LVGRSCPHSGCITSHLELPPRRAMAARLVTSCCPRLLPLPRVAAALRAAPRQCRCRCRHIAALRYWPAWTLHARGPTTIAMPFMALRSAGHADLKRVSSASAGRGRSGCINHVPPSKHRPNLDYIPTVSRPSPVLFFAAATEPRQPACMREAIPHQFHVSAPALARPLAARPHPDLNRARPSSNLELCPTTTPLRPVTALTVVSPLLNVSSQISCTNSPTKNPSSSCTPKPYLYRCLLATGTAVSLRFAVELTACMRLGSLGTSPTEPSPPLGLW